MEPSICSGHQYYPLSIFARVLRGRRPNRQIGPTAGEIAGLTSSGPKASRAVRPPVSRAIQLPTASLQPQLPYAPRCSFRTSGGGGAQTAGGGSLAVGNF